MITSNSVPLNWLHEHPDNLRAEYDADAIKELAASIESVGLLSPILYRKFVDELHPDTPYLQISAGHRRYRALLHLVATKKLNADALVPAIERVDGENSTPTSEDDLAVMLVENLQRVDISPIDEARGYFALANTHKMKQSDIAKLVGRSAAHISKRLALLTLPDYAQAKVNDGSVSLDDAYAIAQIDPEFSKDLLKCVRKGETIRSWEISSAQRKQAEAKSIVKMDKALAQAMIETVEQPEREGRIRLDTFDHTTLKDYKPRKGDQVVRHGSSVTVWRKQTPKEVAAFEQAQEQAKTPHEIWRGRTYAAQQAYREECDAISQRHSIAMADLLLSLGGKELAKGVVERVLTSPVRYPQNACNLLGLEPNPADCTAADGRMKPEWQWPWAELLEGWLATDTTNRKLTLWLLQNRSPMCQRAFDDLLPRFAYPEAPDHGIEPWQDTDGNWITDRVNPEYEAEDEAEYDDEYEEIDDTAPGEDAAVDEEQAA